MDKLYFVLSGGHVAPEMWQQLVGIFQRSRPWYHQQVCRHPIHPLIESLLSDVNFSRYITDWREMLLEYPYVAETDPTRLAYTRSQEHGEADRQTLTSPSKYIRQHCPTMPDHTLRDFIAAYTGMNSCKFVDTTEAMIHAVMFGPHSCMASEFHIHPYSVYAPELGWRMAVRYEGDRIVGRCLCHTGLGEHKPIFVRSYAKPTDADRYSQTDTVIEAWLTQQGYVKHSGWEGRPVRLIMINDDEGRVVMPYIDGYAHHGDPDFKNKTITLTEHTDMRYYCQNTCGMAEDTENQSTCEDCGDRMPDDDTYHVGYHEDRIVCCSCVENAYRYGYGRNGYEYYMSEDDAVYVDSRNSYFHINYLSDNGIVILHNGEYVNDDDAVCIDDEYYHVDGEGETWVTPEDTGDPTVIDDCWQCEASGNWYTDDEDYIEIDGCKYHEDYAPEQESNDTTNPTTEA